MQVAALRSVRLLSSLLGAGVFVASTAIASTASASSLGIDGNTNKPIAGVGHRCGDCHSGGAAPTVAFAGPASLNAGQTGTYTFTVTGGVRAGASVAVTPDSNDGQANVVTLIPGAKMSQKFNEVVQTGPATPAAGKVVFGFSFVAPQYGGTVKLWGAGVAANNNGSTSGDADALTTMTVTVVGPTPGGDAGAKDSGVFVPSDGGSGSDGGTVPGSDGGTVPGTDGGKLGADGSTDEGPGGIPASGDGSCAVGMVGASSTDAGALGAALFTMIGLVAAGSARRRRK
ncbi:MAG: putative lipoprotein [Myxococcaceae bacterium]|nr:putative lipoprotein [Myxococcaceae bacterium]